MNSERNGSISVKKLDENLADEETKVTSPKEAMSNLKESVSGHIMAVIESKSQKSLKEDIASDADDD